MSALASPTCMTEVTSNSSNFVRAGTVTLGVHLFFTLPLFSSSMSSASFLTHLLSLGRIVSRRHWSNTVAEARHSLCNIFPSLKNVDSHETGTKDVHACHQQIRAASIHILLTSPLDSNFPALQRGLTELIRFCLTVGLADERDGNEEFKCTECKEYEPTDTWHSHLANIISSDVAPSLDEPSRRLLIGDLLQRISDLHSITDNEQRYRAYDMASRWIGNILNANVSNEAESQIMMDLVEQGQVLPNSLPFAFPHRLAHSIARYASKYGPFCQQLQSYIERAAFFSNSQATSSLNPSFGGILAGQILTDAQTHERMIPILVDAIRQITVESLSMNSRTYRGLFDGIIEINDFSASHRSALFPVLEGALKGLGLLPSSANPSSSDSAASILFFGCTSSHTIDLATFLHSMDSRNSSPGILGPDLLSSVLHMWQSFIQVNPRAASSSATELEFLQHGFIIPSPHFEQDSDDPEAVAYLSAWGAIFACGLMVVWVNEYFRAADGCSSAHPSSILLRAALTRYEQVLELHQYIRSTMDHLSECSEAEKPSSSYDQARFKQWVSALAAGLKILPTVQSQVLLWLWNFLIAESNDPTAAAASGSSSVNPASSWLTLLSRATSKPPSSEATAMLAARLRVGAAIVEGILDCLERNDVVEAHPQLLSTLISTLSVSHRIEVACADRPRLYHSSTDRIQPPAASLGPVDSSSSASRLPSMHRPYIASLPVAMLPSAYSLTPVMNGSHAASPRPSAVAVPTTILSSPSSRREPTLNGSPTPSPTNAVGSDEVIHSPTVRKKVKTPKTSPVAIAAATGPPAASSSSSSNPPPTIDVSSLIPLRTTPSILDIDGRYTLPIDPWHLTIEAAALSCQMARLIAELAALMRELRNTPCPSFSIPSTLSQLAAHASSTKRAETAICLVDAMAQLDATFTQYNSSSSTPSTPSPDPTPEATFEHALRVHSHFLRLFMQLCRLDAIATNQRTEMSQYVTWMVTVLETLIQFDKDASTEESKENMPLSSCPYLSSFAFAESFLPFPGQKDSIHHFATPGIDAFEPRERSWMKHPLRRSKLSGIRHTSLRQLSKLIRTEPVVRAKAAGFFLWSVLSHGELHEMVAVCEFLICGLFELVATADDSDTNGPTGSVQHSIGLSEDHISVVFDFLSLSLSSLSTSIADSLRDAPSPSLIRSIARCTDEMQMLVRDSSVRSSHAGWVPETRKRLTHIRDQAGEIYANSVMSDVAAPRLPGITYPDLRQPIWPPSDMQRGNKTLRVRPLTSSSGLLPLRPNSMEQWFERIDQFAPRAAEYLRLARREQEAVAVPSSTSGASPSPTEIIQMVGGPNSSSRKRPREEETVAGLSVPASAPSRKMAREKTQPDPPASTSSVHGSSAKRQIVNLSSGLPSSKERIKKRLNFTASSSASLTYDDSDMPMSGDEN